MKLELGAIYSGFVLKEENKLKEINSLGRLFVHEKSGARLYNIENDDDNKVFSISFRTPPKENSGVAHIIEHSVLCGSEKFPLKEPFVELAKGSLNTFLNALTFADKTMYPIASKNEKDFYNLMDVYLDAVFNPNIYKYEEIFMQEGWHYELDNPDDKLTYKGVVYNEMKGAYSSPETILYHRIMQSLFPDSIYKNESGGSPEAIPDLTYEQFLNFHKRYYHPSNSYIYIYGNGDILKQLEFLDNNYLKNYSSIRIDSEIVAQKPSQDLIELKDSYSISQNENDTNKTYMCLNFVCGEKLDAEHYLAFDILEHFLLETPAAPLKTALLKSNIGKDVFGSYDGGIKQPVFSIIVKNSDESKEEQFKKLVSDTLINIISKGIDKKLIEGAINFKEFRLREADYNSMPKGLIYNMRVMDSWLYDGEPYKYLEYDEALKKIKSALTTDYFEKLIQEYILNSKHSSIVILNPQKGLGQEKEKYLEKILDEKKASLTKEEIDKIISNTKKLKERQNARDSKEDLQSIPLLSLEDIDRNAEKLPLVEKEINSKKVLFHPIFTNKIAYLNFYFDMTTVPQELLPYVSLLSYILEKVSTEKYNYAELANEINIYTGGIKSHVEIYNGNNKFDSYHPKFTIRAKATISNLPNLIEILEEVVKKSKFDDIKRLKEIIDETKSRFEMVITDSAHILAANRLISYFSSSGKLQDLVSGLSFYKFLENIESNYDKIANEITEKIEKVYKLIFNTDNIIVGVTCDEEDYAKVEEMIGKTFDFLGDNKLKKYNYSFDMTISNEGLLSPGKVQYVAKGFNFLELGYKYKGTMAVAKTILSLDYLWNKVRVEGGAYGCFASFQLSGNAYFVSYRDPNLKETLNAYDNIPQYLSGFDTNKREMSKYVIGTISRLDSPMTPSMKGEQADEDYIRKISYEDIQRERNEVLATRSEDIKELGSLFEKAFRQNYICVVGGESKLKEDQKLFSSITQIFQ